MKYMGTILFVIIAFFGVLVMCYVQFINPKVIEYKHLKRDQEYISATDLRKSGGTTLFGTQAFYNPILNYDLRSWDAGKNWYAVDFNYKTGELKILGEVEKIYPGLMKHLTGWDDLTKYVEKNGPIKLTDPNGIQVLEKAGFEVIAK
jgi:hypothetical protein